MKVFQYIIISLLLISCSGRQSNVALMTNEELRLIDQGGDREIESFRTGDIEIVGKIRRISVGSDGANFVQFTGVSAIFSKSETSILSDLVPDQLLKARCKLSKSRYEGWLTVENCRNTTIVTNLSADQYFDEYQTNQIRADEILKDKYIAIYGIVRNAGVRTDGRSYVSLSARDGLANVDVIVSNGMEKFIPLYAKSGGAIILYCRAGQRLNEVGEVGLDKCRFLGDI